MEVLQLAELNALGRLHDVPEYVGRVVLENHFRDYGWLFVEFVPQSLQQTKDCHIFLTFCQLFRLLEQLQEVETYDRLPALPVGKLVRLQLRNYISLEGQEYKSVVRPFLEDAIDALLEHVKDMILLIQNLQQTDHLLVCLDCEGKALRLQDVQARIDNSGDSLDTEIVHVLVQIKPAVAEYVDRQGLVLDDVADKVHGKND